MRKRTADVIVKIGSGNFMGSTQCAVLPKFCDLPKLRGRGRLLPALAGFVVDSPAAAMGSGVFRIWKFPGFTFSSCRDNIA